MIEQNFESCIEKAETLSTKVKAHFSHSATTYKINPQLQKIVGEHLLTQLPRDKQTMCLDLGSGPGLFTKALQQNSTHLVSADISQDMLKMNENAEHKLQVDAHNLPINANQFDIVFSSLMIQWCDLDKVLAEVYRVLKPGGKAVISTLVQGSLYELQQAWAKVDQDEHIHHYQHMQSLTKVVNQTKWQRIELQRQQHTFWFESVSALAKELKSLGANYVQGKKRKGLMAKSKWLEMEKQYQTLFACSESNQIPASYQVVYMELVK